MSLAAKTLAVLAALVLLPLSAYAVGSITAPSPGPTPRQDIQIDEAPLPSPSARTARPSKAPEGTDDAPGRKGDRKGTGDDVRVVTPPAAPVDQGRDDRGGGDDGDDGESGDDGDDD